MMKTATTLLIVSIVAMLGTIGFAYSGLYDVSASSSHSGFIDWLLSTTSHASIERRAGEIEVPDLENEDLVLAGINDFDSMCVGCHGGPGKDPEAMGQGLNPPAPDLAEEAAELTPAELFWVTKNGIRMTGMPAWGATHDDESIWPLVAFMTRLPELDALAYRELLASAEGQGHHAEDSSGEEHSHDETTESAGGEIHVHPDGSEHLHEVTAEPEAPPEHDDSTHEHNDD
jgi:mono/diheme cytochrome c family protein